MLTAHNISFARRGTPILTDVTTEVKPGAVTALIGPNGAGKSTLLHILSGAIQPDHGTVLLNGLRLAALPRKALARQRAVLPQSSTISFPFTALQVVLMGRGAHAGVTTRTEDMAIAQEALRMTGAEALADRPFTSLSGGEQQRVQLARVIAQISGADQDEPRFLLLDEPTNHLDLSHQLKILRVARALSRRGVGVFAVLHDPNLAAMFADTVIIMTKGHVLTQGPTHAVLRAEIIEEALGVRVIVQRHPAFDVPHIVPVE
ncbi:heme ABC transporter ATP-binding protein [Acidisoma cellulosilytica]|uniref:Heme ABC transporter ATP-binding protein n=1 Tax=Acidisoma cellulosilyticum TaxID=2802395 RepID=A0A963Z0K2_9PROT|nr:heme ABC transporter ATP-binding protein [Acidisoma cellulosilyticum]MCB8880489.1 heme ABC transporter ATP-binding protein [Acidisoma cellulosilyticum]